MSAPAAVSAPLHIAYCTLGEHKGHGRLWLEGRKVADAGFEPAAKFSAILDVGAGTVRLVRAEDGDRTVSKRERAGGVVQPIIDVCNGFIDRILGKDTRARVVYRQNEIEISVHHFDRMARERKGKIEGIRETGIVRLGSVCTGAGILDNALHEGLRASGLTPKAAFGVEIDARYQDTMLANNRALDGICSVLGSLDEIEPVLLPAIDLLAGGLPCTAASLAGRAKKGAGVVERDGKVGHLVVSFLELVKASNPAVVILENVVPYRSTASYCIAVTMLERLGYVVRERDLYGPDFGSIERRTRLCLVALDPSLDDGTEGCGFLAGIVPDSVHAPRLGDVLEDVGPDDGKWKDLAYLAVKEERDIAKGNGFRRQLVGAEDTGVGVIGRGYAKYRSAEPMLPHPTLRNHARLFTPVEHAKIKGIAPALVEGLPNTTAHEVLGQSVIPAAFKAVAKALGGLLGGGGVVPESVPVSTTQPLAIAQGPAPRASAPVVTAPALGKAKAAPGTATLADLPLFAALAA